MIRFNGTNVLVYSVSPVTTIPARNGGKDFQKRELVIDDSFDKDGRHFPNFVCIEFSGDKMALLDYIAPGHRVNVEGTVSGREYNGRYYNSIRGLSVVPAQMQGGYPASSGYGQQAAPGYPQTSGYQQGYQQGNPYDNHFNG